MDNVQKTKSESGFSAKVGGFFKNLIPKKASSLSAKKARSGWLFVLPFVIGLLFMYLGVIYESLAYSFSLYQKVRGGTYSLTWVGIDNYKSALEAVTNTSTGETFLEKMFTGLGQQAVDVFAIIMLSLFIAILLNQKMVGRAAFRAIFFIPVVVSAGIIADIDLNNALLQAQSSTTGIDMGSVSSGGMGDLVSAMDISMIFSNLGIGTELVTTITNLIGDIYNIVNRSGVQMLIFLAGLQSISPSIYESCQMEGATGWETFWKITLPMISPMILANTVYTIIDSFTAGTNEVMAYILGKSDTTTPSGVQSAAAWSYFILVIIILAIIALIAKKAVFYQRRND